MTNEKVSQYFKYYQQLVEAIKKGMETIKIIGYRKIEIIHVNDDLKKFVQLIDELIESTKDIEVLEIIHLAFMKNMPNKKVISKIHMSESAYYRIKNQLCNKLLLLCVSQGLIQYEEILRIEIR